MAVRVAARFLSGLGELRYEPTPKRIRALLDTAIVVDSVAAVLVWEPMRVVPQYAVPVEDVLAELLPGRPDDGDTTGEPVRLGTGGPLVLTPDTGFGVHSTDGAVCTVRTGDVQRPGAAFRLADADLAGLVVLDFHAFEGWLEEEEPIMAHPRDPFKRIDVRRSSRTVRIERDGVLLAQSERPSVLFETHLPVRYYLPPEDVHTDRLQRSDTTTACAYKGQASYWSLAGEDIAWYYERPLSDAAEVKDMICFFDEHVDVVLDGERRERPQSPWS